MNLKVKIIVINLLLTYKNLYEFIKTIEKLENIEISVKTANINKNKNIPKTLF